MRRVLIRKRCIRIAARSGDVKLKLACGAERWLESDRSLLRCFFFRAEWVLYHRQERYRRGGYLVTRERRSQGAQGGSKSLNSEAFAEPAAFPLVERGMIDADLSRHPEIELILDPPVTPKGNPRRSPNTDEQEYFVYHAGCR